MEIYTAPRCHCAKYGIVKANVAYCLAMCLKTSHGKICCEPFSFTCRNLNINAFNPLQERIT